MKIIALVAKVIIYMALVANVLAFTHTSETEYGIWSILLLVTIIGWVQEEKS